MHLPVALAVLLPAVASAQALFPAPGAAGHDPALAALADRYEQQFRALNAQPFGVSLDAFIVDASDRALVTAFLAQGVVRDFDTWAALQSSPRRLKDIVDAWGEFGDMGMFGGGGAAADAFRYLALKAEGAPAAVLASARAELLRTIAAYHAYANLTGAPGSIARGACPKALCSDPTTPFPATCPWPRSDTWRDDMSGQLPDWIWIDNTSKDQAIGYAFALGALWDAVALDPDVPDAVRASLQADALGMGRALMQVREVDPSQSQIDLVITDARGCKVSFHDLNPREINDTGSIIVLPESSSSQNSFGALASLGIIRTLYHVSGDDGLRTYYYAELVGRRGYPSLLTGGVATLSDMYLATVNFSNVNMAFAAIYPLLRYESDPALRSRYRDVLDGQLWQPGSRLVTAKKMKQAFFGLVWAGLRHGGTDPGPVADADQQLRTFPTPPYFDPYVENCSAAELNLKVCLAIDGQTTLFIDPVAGWGGAPEALDPVPMPLRPPSNYEWRSDPRRVNGGGSSDLNPGADFRLAYWLGRLLQQTLDNDENLSPVVRNPDGTGGPRWPSDAGEPDSGTPDTGAAAGPDAAPPDLPDADAIVVPDAGSDALDAGGAALDAAAGALDAALVDAGKPPDAAPRHCGCAASDGGSFALLGLALLALARRR